MSITCPELYRPKVKWRTKERDEFFRENKDVDIFTLAGNLKRSPRWVLSYMQKLGLRPMSGNPPATYRWGGNPKGDSHASHET